MCTMRLFMTATNQNKPSGQNQGANIERKRLKKTKTKSIKSGSVGHQSSVCFIKDSLDGDGAQTPWGSVGR